MTDLWWMIPVGAFMLWCLIQFFRGGGPPSDHGGPDIATGYELSKGHDSIHNEHYRNFMPRRMSMRYRHMCRIR